MKPVSYSEIKESLLHSIFPSLSGFRAGIFPSRAFAGVDGSSRLFLIGPYVFDEKHTLDVGQKEPAMFAGEFSINTSTV
ncbi:unnamed protein product [Arabis nemorensis]|uniref:Uncharacterized protein n=1 Tax=Arabis nemorensis TaxID=586526 RepID=A0A565B0H1_9BRAS|nr:unnamed protein product [Arabis nemorensis]